MIFGHDFYHGTLRRYIIMFGNIFNEIQVERYDSNGSVIQNVNVPIEYGPKQKFIRRVTTDPQIGREQFSTQLPRLGFEMNGITYAPARKLNTGFKIKKNLNPDAINFTSVYSPVPYDMNFTLSALVRNAEDGTQIIEKIIPFFAPDFTVTMKVLPSLSLNMDIPIELLSISSEDTYEGDFDSRRIISWDLSFVVKGYLFGPVTTNRYIGNATINIKNDSKSVTEPALVSTTSIVSNSDFGFSTTLTTP